jgi:hypothetical protein
MTVQRATLLFLILATFTLAAHAQAPARLRGTITGLDGNVLSVKTREGKDLKLTLADNVVVVAAKAIKLEELKPGDYVGATTRARPDGSHVAIEVHTLAPTTKPGQLDWDLEPNTTMTNGYIGTVSSAGGQEVILDYKAGTQKISVPPGIPVVTNVPADRSYLKPGEYIFTIAQPAADGTLNVQRVSVSKDGVRPPQ